LSEIELRDTFGSFELRSQKLRLKEKIKRIRDFDNNFIGKGWFTTESIQLFLFS